MLIKKAILRIACLMTLLLVLPACSGIDKVLDTKTGIRYENNKVVKTMEVPSDLSAPEFDDAFKLPSLDEGQTSVDTKVRSDFPPDLGDL